jgi:hypothetical protein
MSLWVDLAEMTMTRHGVPLHILLCVDRYYLRFHLYAPV